MRRSLQPFGLVLTPGPLSGAIDDETNDRARRVVNGYFGKLREANTTRWEAARRAFISTNPGIRAQLLLLADVIKYLNKKDEIEPQLLDEDTLLKHVLRIVQPMLEFIRSAEDVDIYDKFSRKFGEGGVREYADNLTELMLDKCPDFGSEDFKMRLARRSDERAKQTDQDVIQLNKDIPAHSSGVRTYEDADYEFMKHIRFEFYKKRNSALGIEDVETEA